jgi:hypothetical protein
MKSWTSLQDFNVPVSIGPPHRETEGSEPETQRQTIHLNQATTHGLNRIWAVSGVSFSCTCCRADDTCQYTWVKLRHFPYTLSMSFSCFIPHSSLGNLRIITVMSGISVLPFFRELIQISFAISQTIVPKAIAYVRVCKDPNLPSSVCLRQKPNWLKVCPLVVSTANPPSLAPWRCTRLGYLLESSPQTRVDKSFGYNLAQGVK